MDLAVVLVTGCSSGFGEAIALGFAMRGETVVATMRRPDDASAALRAVPAIECVALDVTDGDMRREVIAGILARHGRLDILVNNAGHSLFASIEDTSEELERAMFDVNYFGPAEMMRAAFPVMRAQGGGRIVNVGAIGAILATALLGSYSASKHALDAITAVADLEGRPFGIRAASVLPGQFKTSIGTKSPPPRISAPYDAINAALLRNRAEHAADFQEKFDQVVDAVIAAATDPDPRPRYLAGIGIVDELKDSIVEFERLHCFEATRAGVA